MVFSLLLGVFSAGRAPQALAQQDVCAQPHQDVSIPLTDLGEATYVRMDGQITPFTGGLYPGGSNTRPPEHEAAGLAAAAQITPLDLLGNPDPANGRIVMISIGMSNTNYEFGRFMDLARHDPQVNPRLFFINAAQANRTAEAWAEAGAETWRYANREIAMYNMTPAQVQVAWVKQTLREGGDFPGKAQELQADLEAIVRNLKHNYPNIKIAYVSSRTRSFTYWRGLSPEPLAFETGFAVKWMIEKQLNHDPSLNFDPARGEVNAPYLSWGPYLWIDGLNPRADGQVWTAEDLTFDCTHPSPSGAAKVAEMLIEFFKADSTAASWFLADADRSLPATAASSVITGPASSPTIRPVASDEPASTATSPMPATNRTAEVQTTAQPGTLTPSLSPSAPATQLNSPLSPAWVTIYFILALSVILAAWAILHWIFPRRK